MHKLSIVATQKGIVTLALTLVLLTVVGFSALIVARFGLQEQRILANAYREQQAFEAAAAGLQFGAIYLTNNHNTLVVDADNNGYMDSFSNSYTTNVSLPNGSSYTITFTNPVASNLNRIKISSTGKSADALVTRQLTTMINFTPTLFRTSTYSMITKGSTTIQGSSQIINTSTNTNIRSGSAVTINGGAKTVTNSGTTSTNSTTGSDVAQNDTSIQNMSASDLFNYFFGSPMATVKNNANYSYQNSSNTTYNSQLNNLQNGLIWIEQTGSTTASINSTTTIGTASNPVILIVNGNLSLSGTAVIYGFIYVTGNLSTAGSSTIHGALVVGGNATDSGDYSLYYDPTVLSKAQQKLGSFGLVPGSWNDTN